MKTGFFTQITIQKFLKKYGLHCDSFNETALGVMGLTTTIKTKKQSLVLKVFKSSITKREINFDVSIMNYLLSK